MTTLSTRWGRGTDPARVKPEYPRPSLVRADWLCLNGVWDCCINRSPECDLYDAAILVPFPPEAPLSGVGRIVGPEDRLHYRRTFALPDSWQSGRRLLHFGAVDQECAVVLNGVEVGTHRGGYLPFTLDVTDALRPGENTLEVHVLDRTERAPYPRGKQLLVRKGRLGGMFYTPVSGIWKTVWLEPVPERHVTALRLTPRFDEGQVELELTANHPGSARVTISFRGGEAWSGEVEAGMSMRIDLPDFHPWSPDAPDLYDVEVAFGDDRVRGYFGMRAFGTVRDRRGVLRFSLNGKPFFFNGLLDQGYWPDSLMTPPSDAALEHDIRTAKALGFNTLRKHVKIEEERFYYLCDKLGMIVWQDMPCGGGSYNMLFVTYLPNLLGKLCRSVRDDRYRLFAREDAEGRTDFHRELGDMVRQLSPHPCIALWTPFNEGWGQFDAREATALIRGIDPTRLVNEACGWFDQGGGDVYSIHNYFRRLKVSPAPDRVVALTEFGGHTCPEPGHTTGEREYGYRAHASHEALAEACCQLWEEQLIPNLARGLSAAIYTQVSDIEGEINGLMTYDREVLKLDPETARALNRRLYEAFRRLTE